MTIRASLYFGGTVNESGFTGADFAENAELVHTIGGRLQLKADSVPDGETLGADKGVALVAGAYTLDLTATQGLNTTTDGTGKRVRYIFFENHGAASMTISIGASNGYAGFGAAFEQTIGAGKRWQLEGDDAAAVVGAANKTLDIAGTGTETFDYAVIFG